MKIEIIENRPADLQSYGAVSSAFTVEGAFDVLAPTPTAVAGGAPRLLHRALTLPYLKDYDAPPGLAPHAWAQRFDVSSWGVLVARVPGGAQIGGAVVVPGAATVLDIEGLDEDANTAGRAAVLWDLRVVPAWRRRRPQTGEHGGVGSALFRAACAWAQAGGATTLLIETQSTNVPACRFYARQGCELVAARRDEYPAPLTAEIQLIWRRALPGASLGT